MSQMKRRVGEDTGDCRKKKINKSRGLSYDLKYIVIRRIKNSSIRNQTWSKEVIKVGSDIFYLVSSSSK